MAVLPNWFHLTWRRCALEISTAGLHVDAPWRSVRAIRDCWVLSLLFAGTGRLIHGEGIEPLHGPCAWLAPPGLARREELRPVQGRLRLAEIAFLVHPGPGATVPLIALEHPRCVPIRDPAQALALAGTIAAAMHRWKPVDEEAALTVRPDLDRLLTLHLHDRAADGEVQRCGVTPAPRWFDALLRWVSAHLAERDLGVARLAAEAGYSPSVVAHAFTRHTGSAPAAWIRGKRLAMAERLLRDARHLTVAEIARRCGFANGTMLTRHFRTLHATSPARWRTQASPEPDRR